MVRFSYKNGCGVCECTLIEALKEELAWANDEWLWVIYIINKTVFKTVSYTTKKLKNKAF